VTAIGLTDIPRQQSYVLKVINGGGGAGAEWGRDREIVLSVDVCRFEKKVGRRDTRATAAALVPGPHGRRPQPGGELIARCIGAAFADERVVTWVIDELAELLH